MFCTKCGHANRDAAKFCAQCGAELVRRSNAAAQVAAPVAVPEPTPAPAPTPKPEPAPAPVVQATPAPVADTPPPAAAETPAADDAATSVPPPVSTNSSSRNAIVLGGVVLACVLAAATTWMLTRDKTPEAMQTASAPAAGATTEPTPEPAPIAPAPVPESLPAAPGMPVKPAVEKPVVLSEAEVRQLVARMQQEPTPSSCQAVTQRIRKDHNTGPAQAGDIARRAYPQLCASSGSPPVIAAPVQQEQQTIDQIFETRAAAECSKGLTGLVCREVLLNKLCFNHWSTNPPPGQSRCRQADSNENN